MTTAASDQELAEEDNLGPFATAPAAAVNC